MQKENLSHRLLPSTDSIPWPADDCSISQKPHSKSAALSIKHPALEDTLIGSEFNKNSAMTSTFRVCSLGFHDRQSSRLLLPGRKRRTSKRTH